jgi:flagellar basal-body rod modification protein FlgD
VNDPSITSTMPAISAGPATPTGTGLKGTTDEFLKLFMAQLQHQDPMSPQSGSDMVAQLAQFSAVEQATQTNTQLANLAAAQASNASASMATLVGRTCDASAGDFSIGTAGGSPPSLSVTSPNPMTGASVVIKDANGKEIRRIPIAAGAKDATLAWDGKDARGVVVPPGTYNISVDSGSTTSTITARWSGRVDAVELTTEGPRLRMGDVLLAPADIRTIGVGT